MVLHPDPAGVVNLDLEVDGNTGRLRPHPDDLEPALTDTARRPLGTPPITRSFSSSSVTGMSDCCQRMIRIGTPLLV